MFSKIFLNKTNLVKNVKQIKEKAKAPICVMVKANAYGHGIKEMVTILEQEIDYFGVSNQKEGKEVRDITDKTVIIFGACDDYLEVMKNDISFALFSYEDAKKIVKLAKVNSLVPRMHLCINSGMNRYGVKSLQEFVKIIKFLDKYNLELEGVYTHFSSLTTDKTYTEKQKKTFYDYLTYLPEEWKTIVHVGGGHTIFSDVNADLYRVGLAVYGYGYDFVKPILHVESEIVDIQKVEKGEHVGYLCGFTAEKNMKVATIPLGYGDGFPRKLSNKFSVEINGKTALSCGNICMDAFMVDVSNIKCKKGDKVVIFDDARTLAEVLDTTPYEVLTNLTKFRGEKLIF